MRKGLKIILYLLGSILLLLVIAVVYLNSPWGQNFVRGRAEAFLQNKLKTIVHIGNLGYGLPKYIVIDDVLFLDQAKDTLLSVGTLKVDVSMLQLFHKKVDIQQIVLQSVHSHIYRNAPDTTFNFSYIIAAFTGNAAKDTTKVKDTTSALAISLDRVKLDDIHARFDDYTGGTQFAINLDHLDLHMKKLDLDKMLFHVKDLSVSGLQTVFVQDTSYLPPVVKDTAGGKLQVIADNVDLKNIGFRYNDNLNKFLFALQLGGLQLQLNRFNRSDNLVDVKKLAVSNSAATLSIGKSSTPPSPVDTIVKIDTTEGWDVRAKDIDLSGLNFKMDNNNAPRLPYGFDYAHLDIHDLALKLKNLLYSTGVSGNIEHMAVTDRSGVDLKELKTAFSYGSKGVVLKDLYLQTPNTIIQNHIEVHYPSLLALRKHADSLQVNVNVEKSIVGLHDVALFMPELRKQPLFRKYDNGHISLEAAVTGFLNNLNIAHFYLQGLDNTVVLLNGRLSGLPDAKKLSYNLHISKLNSSRNDVTALLPPGTLPSSFRLPDRFGIVGRVSGNVKDYNADLALAGSDGAAHIKGTVATAPGKGKEKYDLAIKTMNLDLGHILLKDSLIGAISADLTVKGSSFDVKTMNAAAGGSISSAFIKGYRYHDVTLDGKVSAQKGTLNLKSADSNLQVQLNASGDFSGKYPAVIADVHMDSVDFQALKLYKTELRTRGHIYVDFPELNPDYPNGRFTWYQPVILADGKRYFMDSVYAISRPSPDTGQNIFVNLGVLDAHVTGKTPLTKIGAIVQDHINRHYASGALDSLKEDIAKLKGANNKVVVSAAKPASSEQKTTKDTVTIPAGYDLNLVAHAYDKPMLRALAPGLTSFDSIHINGSLTPKDLKLDVSTSEIIYGTWTVENANIQVRGSDSALTYKVNVDQVSQPNFALYYADIHGALDRNTITTDISLSDAGKRERFALKADMRTSGDSQVIQLQQGLKLNYDVWQVTEPNRIVMVNKGFFIQNFEISNKDQFIKANNDQPAPNTPLKIAIKNFSLANLTNIASKNDTLPANGIIDGDVTIEQMSPVTKMEGDLRIRNLSIYGDTLGNLQAIVNNKTENQLDTKVTLNGNGNDISLTGIYYLQANNGNELSFNVAVNALALNTIQGVAKRQIKNSSGFVRGNLKVQGKMASPEIVGELHTDNLKTTVVAINTDFKMPAERIEFNASRQVVFNNFTLQDSAGNKAQISGTVGIANPADPDFNLDIKADHWRAVHNTAKDNKEFYGDLILSTKMKVSGTIAVPSVDGNLSILKGTQLTVSNPQKDPELQSAKGIVVIVNMRDSSRGKALMPRHTDSLKVKHKLAAGSDININITVDKNAEFTLIIDEASGDFVKVRGDAYLNTAVTPGGTFDITGNYLLHSGVYQMNYNFIKRRFLIQDGSTITFGGDPLKNTMLDVTATYETKTPPYDLVSRQVPDPAQLNYYKQSLPFNVNMHMKGDLMHPAFTFDVVLPENRIYPLTADQIELVQAKLSQIRQDTGELNKQVFAVLILGRFVSDDPFNSSGGGGVQFAAIQSVSTFIGEQLNRAASRLVKGVDLSVDLATTEDYTTGDMRQRTDLNVAASKRVLNDRLKLTVGNDFEVEGPQSNNNSGQSSMVPSNLAADYLLSSDGRYTVRVYRTNYNEGPLQGYVTETGVNFIVSVDYNKFKNIFKKKSANKNAKGVSQ